MSDTHHNEPAFPVEYERETLEGLTKREFFAIKCFEGICAAGTEHDVPHDKSKAKQAVENADALIKELNEAS